MTTFREYAAEYLAYLQACNFSARTGEEVRLTLRRFLDWLAGSYSISTPDQMQKAHLEAWFVHIAARHTHRGCPLRPATINKTNTLLRGFLKHLVRAGALAPGLPAHLGRVKEPRVLSRSVLNHAQVQAFSAAIETTTSEGFRNRTIVELLYSTGIRARELLGLDTGDLSVEQRTVLVHGKGNKDRIVPVGKTALRFLEGYLSGIRPFLVRDPAERALFLDRSGTRYGYHNLQRWIRRHADAQGLDVHITAHTFRRSFATEMIRGGANLYHIKEMLGHESLKTLRNYTRLTIVDLLTAHGKCHPSERGDG